MATEEQECNKLTANTADADADVDADADAEPTSCKQSGLIMWETFKVPTNLGPKKKKRKTTMNQKQNKTERSQAKLATKLHTHTHTHIEIKFSAKMMMMTTTLKSVLAKSLIWLNQLLQPHTNNNKKKDELDKLQMSYTYKASSSTKAAM